MRTESQNSGWDPTPRRAFEFMGLMLENCVDIIRIVWMLRKSSRLYSNVNHRVRAPMTELGTA